MTTYDYLWPPMTRYDQVILVREGVKNIRGGGVYQFCALRAPDADPPHFRPIPSGPPPKMQVLGVHPPQIDFVGKIFKGKFCEPTPKKQNNSKYTL